MTIQRLKSGIYVVKDYKELFFGKAAEVYFTGEIVSESKEVYESSQGFPIIYKVPEGTLIIALDDD